MWSSSSGSSMWSSTAAVWAATTASQWVVQTIMSRQSLARHFQQFLSTTLVPSASLVTTATVTNGNKDDAPFLDYNLLQEIKDRKGNINKAAGTPLAYATKESYNRLAVITFRSRLDLLRPERSRYPLRTGPFLLASVAERTSEAGAITAPRRVEQRPPKRPKSTSSCSCSGNTVTQTVKISTADFHCAKTWAFVGNLP